MARKRKQKEPVETVNKSVDEIVSEVLKGEWGTGRERRELLTKAGYDYNLIQSKVMKEIYGRK